MIRIATAADAPAIADIFNENIEERGFAKVAPSSATAPKSGEEPRRQRRASPDICARGRERRHPRMVRAEAALHPAVVAEVAEVALYVKRSSRNRVVGAQLLVRLLDAARAREFKSLIAMVLAKNEASQRGLGFAGFVKVARVRDAAFLHGHWVDMMWLQKDLDCEEEPSIAHYAARLRIEAVPSEATAVMNACTRRPNGGSWPSSSSTSVSSTLVSTRSVGSSVRRFFRPSDWPTRTTRPGKRQSAKASAVT